jgi:hypothetical protein
VTHFRAVITFTIPRGQSLDEGDHRYESTNQKHRKDANQLLASVGSGVDDEASLKCGDPHLAPSGLDV